MKNQKSLTNKGFSLVELIIVVAIMAVLIGVLAPQYLRYVEKSRLQKDNTSIAEVADVIKMMSAEESLVTKFDGGLDFTFEAANEFALATPTDTDIAKELTDTLGVLSDVKLTSNTYTDGTTDVVIHAETDSTTHVMKITCAQWTETVGGTPVPGGKTF